MKILTAIGNPELKNKLSENKKRRRRGKMG